MRYAFDVKVLDAANKELQPVEGKDVSVSFAMAEVGDNNFSSAVYHIEESEERVRYPA